MSRIISVAVTIIVIICVAAILSLIFNRDLYEAIAPMALGLAALNNYDISEIKDKEGE